MDTGNNLAESLLRTKSTDADLQTKVGGHFRNRNSWANMEISQGEQDTADTLRYEPRGSKFEDIADEYLPSLAEQSKHNMWPPTRVLGFSLALVSMVLLLFFVEISTPKEKEFVERHPGVSFDRVNVCLALLVPMIFLWLFNVVNPNLTAMLPIALLGLYGIADTSKTASLYFNNISMLFVGVFMVATAMEASNVHRRFALHIVSRIGKTPATFMLSFMLPPFFLSFFSSNTGMTALMLPIAMSSMTNLIENADGDEEEIKALKNFEKGLYMAIAYSATIGGTATIVASPPNAIVVNKAEEMGLPDVTFMQWMGSFLPMAIVLEICCFGVMYMTYGRQVTRISTAYVEKEKKKMGKINRDEKVIAALFLFLISWMILEEWTSKKWFGTCTINKKIDYSVRNKDACDAIPSAIWSGTFKNGAIALVCGTFLFFIPSVIDRKRNLLNWKLAESGIPWGIIMLMGSGNALSYAFKDTNTTKWIAEFLRPLGDLPFFWLVLIVVTLVAFLTEITSNTATTNILLPIFIEFADQNNRHPLSLAIPCAQASSMAFMLPIATPPNAVVLGTGKVAFLGFVKAGWKLNFIGIACVTIFTCTMCDFVFGLSSPSEQYQVNWACRQPNATMACPG